MQAAQAKIAILDEYLASSRVVNAATVYRVINTVSPPLAGPWQVETLIARSKRRSLLMATDEDDIFMSRSLNVMPKTTEQNLFVRSDKYEAEVTV